MNIFLAQLNYTIGAIEENLDKMVTALKKAEAQKADLIIFSELCICGYPPQDLLEFDDFIMQCEEAVHALKKHTKNIGVIVGAPSRNLHPEGKNLMNSAWFIYQEQIQHVIHKSCLPTYDIFDEYRYFEPAFDWRVVPFKGKKLAITICEDIWSLDEDQLYRVCPNDELMKQGPDLMINLSASPFDYDQREKRMDILKANVQKYRLPFFYCNTVGAQTEIIFDGGSVIIDGDGKTLKAFPQFEEAVGGVDIDHPDKIKKEEAGSKMTYTREKLIFPLRPAVGNRPLFTRTQVASLPYNPTRNMDRIYRALITGIRDYFGKMGFKKAILGSSGGIDSAVGLSLACEALGKENVYAILMPSPFSSRHSIEDARQLSVNLGNPYDIIPIEKVYHAFLETLKPQFKALPFDLAEENLQARSRGNLLMALANKLGFILLNTSNKSELAIGYGTLYGDMAGGISVLGDVYKTQVYALANYINREKEIIPKNIFSKPPSAELHPDQKDSDSLPEYDQLDAILYRHIEHRLSERQIMERTSFEPELIEKVLKMVRNSEYKRRQFCPIFRVSSNAFGTGRKMPVVRK